MQLFIRRNLKAKHNLQAKKRKVSSELITLPIDGLYTVGKGRLLLFTVLQRGTFPLVVVVLSLFIASNVYHSEEIP